MVGGCFRCRIGAVRCIRRRFREWRILRAQGAIDFIGRDVQETETILGLARQAGPIGTRGFEQAESAIDVGRNEFTWAMDRAIDVAFCGKVHDGARLVFCQQARDVGGVANIAAYEDMPWVVFQAGQITEIACVGQFIEVDDGLIVECQPVAYKIGTDEAGAAGH